MLRWIDDDSRVLPRIVRLEKNGGRLPGLVARMSLRAMLRLAIG